MIQQILESLQEDAATQPSGVFIANIFLDVDISEWPGQTAELSCVLPVDYEPQNKVTLNLRCTSGVWSRQKDVKLHITLL